MPVAGSGYSFELGWCCEMYHWTSTKQSSVFLWSPPFADCIYTVSFVIARRILWLAVVHSLIPLLSLYELGIEPPHQDSLLKCPFIYLFLKILFIWERERQGDRAGAGWEAEANSLLSREPNVGLWSQDPEIMTWAEGRCLNNWATRVPLKMPL